MLSAFYQATVLLSLGALPAAVSAADARTGTPLMGWNTYNYYNCNPSESIVKSNAQGLVSLGLAKLGYVWVTPDCGWNSAGRDSAGRQIWNPSLFPSGGKALGDFLHGLGLKFGVYSGAGVYQCGSTNQPASLGHEQTDSQAYADWGADSLKYDNCYPVNGSTMVDYTSSVAVSPTRHQAMASALSSVNRNIVFQVCQWGVGTDVGTWASAIAQSWRISNDIYNAWRSIWRITNEVVPYWKHTAVGAYPDMDMLIVGLKALSLEEERFHFGMWAINKSPLVIGAPMDTSITPSASLQILSNTEVIAINQDSLGQQAQIARRYTEEQWDVWVGNLSGSRLVVGLANWKNNSQSVSVDLGSVLGVSSASARDVWAAKNLGTLTGTYSTTLAGHQLQLLVLSSVVKTSSPLKSTGYYTGANAALSGAAKKTSCSSTQCLPSHTKISNIGQGASAAAVTFSGVSANSAGTKVLGIDYINYDVALDTAWADGSNTRNMTIAVNGGTAKRWAFPISGGDWYETGRLLIEVPGFTAGSGNKVVFQAVGAAGTEWAPDLVGFEVFEK